MKISWGIIQYKIDFESPDKQFFKELDLLGEDRVVLGKYIDRVTTLQKSSVNFHDSLFDPFKQETESFEYLSLLQSNQETRNTHIAQRNDEANFYHLCELDTNK